MAETGNDNERLTSSVEFCNRWRDHVWRDKVAIWAGRLLIVAGLVSLAGVFFHRSVILRVIMDVLGWVDIPSEPSLFAACMALVLAGGIRRRFRPAHTVLAVVMGLSVLDSLARLVFAHQVTQMINRLHVRGVYRDWAQFQTSPGVSAAILALSVTSFVVVLLARPAFRARFSSGSKAAALISLIGGLFLSFVVAFLLTLSFPRDLDTLGQKFVWSVRSTFGVRTPPASPGFGGHHGYEWTFVVASTVSTLVLIFSLLVLWRSGRGSGLIDADEELRIRRLLLEHGEDDSLGYFATRRDKAVVFAPDGRAAVTFRNEGSVSVASADPIGRAESWDDAIAVWLGQCREHGLYPAVLSASTRGARAYVEAGLKAWSLGDEAIIDTDTFSLRGRSMRPVRQAVTRVERCGYTTQVRCHDELGDDELAELSRLADDWRGNETERGFSMALNRLGDRADGRCVVITAHDARGAVRGFLSFVPWGSRGLSLDLMRRDRQAENGLNEFMVAHLAEAAPALGIRRISLNFAVFRNVFADADEVGAGPITRVTDKALSIASKFWQLETLYRSNDKYHPEWVPRFLCYDAELTVPRAGFAMGVAEGFVPLIGPRLLVGPKPADHQPPRPEAVFVERVQALEADALTPRMPEPRRSEQQRVRREKLARMEAGGVEGYPVAVPRTARIEDVVTAHGRLPADHRTGERVSVTGRVRALRDFGGVSFVVLDEDGARLQAMATRDVTPAEKYDHWRHWIDLGDIVSVTGEIVTSKHAELSVHVSDWQMAAKCMSPIPDLHSPFRDPDARIRNRSLDLIVNRDSMDMLLRRSRGVRAFRDAFDALGYTEVETPMLQAVHGGASARPFKTHINAYGMDLFMRIAPELYLKRLAIGGMQKVFELNRNFRNEGADATHNPEFTSIEAYDAYGDYLTMRDLTREVLLAVARAVNGGEFAERPRPDGTIERVDLSGQWPTIPVHEAVSRACGVTLTSASSRDEVAAVCAAHGVDAPREKSAGELVVELYDELVEGQTMFPTFYIDFPVETSPLTRAHRGDPRLSERWDLVAFGAEIGTAYSELVDPIEQRKRLTEQSLKAAAGDVEAMSLDEAFLSALEYAMPPTGGLGIGVDRSIMMMLGAPIRATLAFPFVRPQG